MRGHGHGKENGCGDVVDVGVFEGDVDKLGTDAGKGTDGDVFDVGSLDAQLAKARRVGRRQVVTNQRLFKVGHHSFQSVEVFQDSCNTSKKKY